MNKIKEQINKFLIWFNELSLIRKLILIGIPFLVAILLLCIAYFFSPHYGILFSNLDPSTLQKVEYELSKLGVDYSIDIKKGVVYVPKDQVEKLRIYLTEQGIISPEHKVGFEIFDKQSFTVSDFVEHINYLRALEGELERTIKAINAIEDAKVNIALPKQSIFARPEEEPRASVLIKLKPGMDLTPAQIKAIRDLVVASVVGLKPQNVVIVDQYGRDLTSLITDDSIVGLASNQLKLKEQYEHKLEKQIEQILDSVVGWGNAKVKVTLYLNFSQREEKTYEVNPDKTAVVSQQKEQKQKKTIQPAGVPGSESNIPPGRGKFFATQSLEKEKKSITNYEISYIQRIINDPTITVKKVSVGVILNSNVKGIDPEKIKQFLISSLGLNPKRGDKVSVVVLPFKGKEEFEKAFIPESKERVNWKFYGTILFITIIILGTLIFLLWKRKKVREGELEVYGGLAGAPVGAAAVSEKAEESLIKKLARLSKENPELYKKLVLQWLKSEE